MYVLCTKGRASQQESVHGIPYGSCVFELPSRTLASISVCVQRTVVQTCTCTGGYLNGLMVYD
jgi:hypothetical protein